MNLSQNLSDHFHDAVDRAEQAGPDLDRLGRVARIQGTRARRRRRAALAMSGVAGVGVLALGASSLTHQSLAHPSAAGRAATFAGDPAPTTPTAAPAPAYALPTARGVVVALGDLATQQVPGTTDEYAGQGDVDPTTRDHHEIYSQVTLHPDGDPGASVLGINIQPGLDYVSSCGDGHTLQCTHATRADGTQVTTYAEHTVVADGTGIRWVADVLHPDGDRVVISSSNGYDLPSSQWRITRPEPALTMAQLTDLATSPIWLGDFPASYDQRGEALTPYTDYDHDDVPASSPAP